MIKQLRKRHVQTWTILLFALPAIIISGWLAIKKPVTTTQLLQPDSANALPVILKTVEKENYIVQLRTNKQRSQMQLEWINKSAITAPSALIYNLTQGYKENKNEQDLIGRIDSRGTYYFALKNDSMQGNRFILYDFIHRKIIDSINF